MVTCLFQQACLFSMTQSLCINHHHNTLPTMQVCVNYNIVGSRKTINTCVIEDPVSVHVQHML